MSISAALRTEEHVCNPDGLFNKNQDARKATASGDTISLTTGTCTEAKSGFNLYIDKTITLLGGYTCANFVNQNPSAIVFAILNLYPSGVGEIDANFPIGVGYDNEINKWAIFSQNGNVDTMPLGAAFNVYVVGNYKLYLPLILR